MRWQVSDTAEDHGDGTNFTVTVTDPRQHRGDMPGWRRKYGVYFDVQTRVARCVACPGIVVAMRADCAHALAVGRAVAAGRVKGLQPRPPVVVHDARPSRTPKPVDLREYRPHQRADAIRRIDGSAVQLRDDLGKFGELAGLTDDELAVCRRGVMWVFHRLKKAADRDASIAPTVWPRTGKTPGRS